MQRLFYQQYHKREEVLNRSAWLLSSRCHRRWCVERLKRLPCASALTDIPVFLQQEGSAAFWDTPPPLGLQGSREHLARALASLPQPGPPRSLRRDGGCRRCVVVGSGGILHGSHLGSHIDQYDVIIRMNNAPVLGYERDAGSRTTIRLMYPEGAPSSADEYNKTSIVALVVFKSLDLDWLTSVIAKQPLGFWSKLWFWKEVVDDIPLRAENFRILHPEIIRKTGEVLQKYSQKQGNSMVPTLGAGAVVMALQLCDHVSLAGFGYNMQNPHAPLHYYETIRMAAMKAQVSPPQFFVHHITGILHSALHLTGGWHVSLPSFCYGYPKEKNFVNVVILGWCLQLMSDPTGQPPLTFHGCCC
ncbi:ST3 beta-galactoside alpha-2,3-sialyltransferase 7 isoform X3 [Festucalex cinctus]